MQNDLASSFVQNTLVSLNVERCNIPNIQMKCKKKNKSNGAIDNYYKSML